MPLAGVTFQCALDGAAFTACTSPKAYPGPLSEGAHTFRVRALANGQQSATTSFTWAVDTTPPPAPAIVGKPAGVTNSATAGFSFTDGEAGVGFQCKLDAGAYAPCASPVSYAKLADGPHVFSVQAVDAAGNASSGAGSWSWTIDTVRPPQPVLTQRPHDPTGAATTIFAWTDAEAGVSFQCNLENGAWKACASPYQYVVDTHSNQQHQFGVRAVDPAGNSSADTTFSWKVAESAPVAFRIAGSAGGLAPGRWQPIPVTITNPNSAPIYVSALTVAVSADSTPPGCSSATNIELQQATGLASSPVAVPANGSATIPAAQQPRIRLKDLPTVNQDACKGKAFAFTFTGTANN
jgi:hypothetical protein